MKTKIRNLIILSIFIYNPLSAQHIDINLNVLNFIFSKYELGIDYGVNTKSSIGGNINITSKNMTKAGGKNYTEFNFIPTYKYFFSPEKDNDGLYIGAYSRIRNSSSKENEFLTTENSTVVTQKTDISSFAFGLGALLGYKWVSSNGFNLEAEFGIGKFISNSVSYSNKNAEDKSKNLTTDWNENDYLPVLGNSIPIDLRLGLKIGYRIK